MNTVNGYVQEIRGLHGVIVQSFIEGYTLSDVAKNDATLIEYMKVHEQRLRTDLTGAVMDTIHKSSIEGLQGNPDDLMNLGRAENRAAFARAANEMNNLMVGRERFGIVY